MDIGRVPKGWRQLAHLVKKQGWTIEPSGGGHLLWRNPDGATFVSSSTPSENRSIKNFTADLRKHGALVTQEELNQFTRFEAKVRTSVLNMDIKSAGKGLAKVTLDNGMMPTERSMFAYAWLVASTKVMSRKYDDEAFELSIHETPVRCSCGTRIFDDTMNLANHIFDYDRGGTRFGHRLVFCDESFVSSDEDKPAPPNTIACPECDFWIYKSQPGQMAKHLVKKHPDLELCMACFDFIEIGTLAEHTETDCVVLADEAEEEAEAAVIAATTPAADRVRTPLELLMESVVTLRDTVALGARQAVADPDADPILVGKCKAFLAEFDNEDPGRKNT